MKKADLAWIGGLMTGDGSLYMVKNRPKGNHSPHYQIQMGIVSTEADVIEKVHEIMQHGYVQTRQTKSCRSGTVYRWVSTSAEMLPNLKQLLPYLIGRKRKIAEVLISFQETMQKIHQRRMNEKRSKGQYRILPPEEIERREKVYLEIRKLNDLASAKNNQEVK